MTRRRSLVALLFWLDQLPPSRARWEAEALVLDELAALGETSAPRGGTDPPPASGTFEAPRGRA